MLLTLYYSIRRDPGFDCRQSTDHVRARPPTTLFELSKRTKDVTPAGLELWKKSGVTQTRNACFVTQYTNNSTQDQPLVSRTCRRAGLTMNDDDNAGGVVS